MARRSDRRRSGVARRGCAASGLARRHLRCPGRFRVVNTRCQRDQSSHSLTIRLLPGHRALSYTNPSGANAATPSTPGYRASVRASCSAERVRFSPYADSPPSIRARQAAARGSHFQTRITRDSVRATTIDYAGSTLRVRTARDPARTYRGLTPVGGAILVCFSSLSSFSR
jgi:hypothetical protein